MAANGTRPLVDRMTSPRWGVSIPLDEDTEGFRNDKPKHLLSKFHLNVWMSRLYRDEPLLVSRLGDIRFRFGLGGFSLRGHSNNVTVDDLKGFSPELVDVVEGAPEVLQFNSSETEVFNAVGRDILDGEIVPGVRATGLGLVGFAGLSIAGGHHVFGERWHLFLAEFTLGFNAGVTYLNLTAKRQEVERSDSIYGWTAAPTFAMGLAKFCEQTTGSCITTSLEMQIGVIRADGKTHAILVPVIFQITLDTTLIDEFFDPGKHPL